MSQEKLVKDKFEEFKHPLTPLEVSRIQRDSDDDAAVLM
jgi:hypothetical protein